MTTDPADADCDDTPDPVHAVLDNGWTLTAPEGTDKAVLDFVLQELENNDALRIFEDAHPQAENLLRYGSEPPLEPSVFGELLHRKIMADLEERLQSRSALESFQFGDRKMGDGPVTYNTAPEAKPEPWWYTSNPGSDSDVQRQVKRRFIDAQQPYHWRADDIAAGAIFGWDPAAPADDTYGHIAVMGDHGVLHHYPSYVDADGTVYRDFSSVPDLARLTAKWAAHPPARPGWTGSIAGPPRPVPIKPTPWQTLPKGVTDGKRTVIIEPGADNNPDARLLELRGGQFEDVGPAFPNGLRPAYRGKPAPIPWDSPLADPLADLRAAGGGTAYGEHHNRPHTEQ